MDREQLIDRAAEILWRTDMGLSLDGLEWSNTSNQDSYQRQASAVLDAILPAITTVEELEALPPETYLIGKALTGRPHFWWRREMDFLDAYLRAFGPFTVWRPS